MSGCVLIVDDDPVQRRLLAAVVLKLGHKAVVADGGEAGLEALARQDDISVVILDLAMPGLDGLGVLKAMQARNIRVPVIVQTVQGSIETVVQAMRHGAFDFVVKPASPMRLQAAIASALKVEAAEGRAKSVSTRSRDGLTFKDLLAQSPAMEKVVQLGRKAAASHIPILIEGESGVGKELVARAIQESSNRNKKPFVTVNCGAIPENLVESILFGHEKGAFTGATDKHVGKFVEADGGTLFLDEVGDLPLDVQVKLLRAVQEGEIDPVGSRQTIKVDIRLISATHRDLTQLVKEGRFREDLFYRLNVFPVFVPPLRDRREDIAGLVQHFMAHVAVNGSPRGISPEALALLQAYDWPGNVRQLENAIFRAAVLCEGDVLTLAEFPQIQAQLEGEIRLPVSERALIMTPEPSKPLPGGFPMLDEHGEMRTLESVELEMICFAMDHYKGRMSEVARRLGIGRSTLYRKLREYGIDPGAVRNVDAETDAANRDDH